MDRLSRWLTFSEWDRLRGGLCFLLVVCLVALVGGRPAWEVAVLLVGNLLAGALLSYLPALLTMVAVLGGCAAEVHFWPVSGPGLLGYVGGWSMRFVPLFLGMALRDVATNAWARRGQPLTPVRMTVVDRAAATRSELSVEAVAAAVRSLDGVERFAVLLVREPDRLWVVSTPDQGDLVYAARGLGGRKQQRFQLVRDGSDLARQPIVSTTSGPHVFRSPTSEFVDRAVAEQATTAFTVDGALAPGVRWEPAHAGFDAMPPTWALRLP